MANKILLLVLVCCSVWQPHVLASENNEVNKIVILGDSLSAGFGIAQMHSWPSLLQKRLTKQGLPWQVVNASISGVTSSEGLGQLKNGLLEKLQPKIVVVELGANDGLRGLSLKAMQANLNEIIRLTQAANAKVLLLGMRLPPNYGRRYTTSFAAVYKNVVAEHKVAYHPFFLAPLVNHPELFQADGLHPTAAAQKFILAEVWKPLQGLLEAD